MCQTFVAFKGTSFGFLLGLSQAPGFNVLIFWPYSSGPSQVNSAPPFQESSKRETRQEKKPKRKGSQKSCKKRRDR